MVQHLQHLQDGQTPRSLAAEPTAEELQALRDALVGSKLDGGAALELVDAILAVQTPPALR